MNQRIHTVLLVGVLIGIGWLVVVGPREQPRAQPTPQPVGRYSLHLNGTDQLILDSVTGDVYSLSERSGMFVVFQMNLPSQRLEVYPVPLDPQKQAERVLEYYRKHPPQSVKP